LKIQNWREETLKNSNDNQELKRLVGIAAAGLVTNGMICGIGTGSTVAFFIEELGRRVNEKNLEIIGVPTSFQSKILCQNYGIPIRDTQDCDMLDLAIDGADEVDPELNVIKGGGAAQTREKIVAAMAKKFVVIVDETKLVPRLNHAFPVPVEIIPAALQFTIKRFKSLGGESVLRLGVRKDGPVVTDNGQFIVDVQFKPGSDLRMIDRELHLTPGVVETGLFFDMAAMVLVGSTAEMKVNKMVKAVDN
jgi:ribose 5-phosphate isomerase A